MTIEQSIETLKEMAFTAYGHRSDALDMAISALSDYDKMQKISLDLAFENDELMNKSRWIPTTERLPEYDEDIIITHKGTMGQPITSVSYFDGDFRTEDGEGYFIDVIAWMPLPEPYKAERGETR